MNITSRCSLAVLLSLVLLISSGETLAQRNLWLKFNGGQSRLPTEILTLKGHMLVTEIARTARQRQDGLSFRAALGTREAMLFVYSKDQTLHFTMQHASIPLSIAFIRSDGEIVDIQQMQPHTDGPYSSRQPARFALEVNQGWFSERGVRVGDMVVFPAGASWAR